jgi:branched-subunit amino acid ABC-type transport system permease component
MDALETAYRRGSLQEAIQRKHPIGRYESAPGMPVSSEILVVVCLVAISPLIASLVAGVVFGVLYFITSSQFAWNSAVVVAILVLVLYLWPTGALAWYFYTERRSK